MQIKTYMVMTEEEANEIMNKMVSKYDTTIYLFKNLLKKDNLTYYIISTNKEAVIESNEISIISIKEGKKDEKELCSSN